MKICKSRFSYQPTNFYTSILLMYILQPIYIQKTFFSSKGTFSADASEVFIPDIIMNSPRKCNETMVDFNVHFPRFYAVFATVSPFINKRFVTKLKCFLANLRCFRDFQLGSFGIIQRRTFVLHVFFSILRSFHNKTPFGNMRFGVLTLIERNLSSSKYPLF